MEVESEHKATRLSSVWCIVIDKVTTDDISRGNQGSPKIGRRTEAKARVRSRSVSVLTKSKCSSLVPLDDTISPYHLPLIGEKSISTTFEITNKPLYTSFPRATWMIWK
jgi:hypothetical protein